MRRKLHEPELPWASFADALAGMLFIFLITSFYFAMRQSDALEELELKSEEAQATAIEAQQAREEARGLQAQLSAAEKHAANLTSRRGKLNRCLTQDDELETFPQPSEGRIPMYITGVPWFETNQAALNERQRHAVRIIQDCLLTILERTFEGSDGRAKRIVDEYRVLVYLEGHTDGQSINDPQADSNWELSGRRSAAVVRRLLESPELQRAAEEKELELLAVGMADRHPAWQAICDDPSGLHTDAMDRAVCIALEAGSLEPLRRVELYGGDKCPTMAPDAATAHSTELLIAWANRCPAGGRGVRDARWARLRRVDLRLELIPRVSRDG